jgi:transposase
MIKIDFTEEEKKALDYGRYNYPHPRVQGKMEALWLKSQGLSHKEICRLTGISPNTLCGYLRAYQEGGIEALKKLKFYQPQSELSEHTATIEAYFREHPPASVKEAMAKIEELTGIKRLPKRGAGAPSRRSPRRSKSRILCGCCAFRAGTFSWHSVVFHTIIHQSSSR